MSQKAFEVLSSSSEKVHFSVLDVTDGRRYKVFLRPVDIPKLKISKIRKTLSSIAQKPPFSFELWLNGEPLRDMEEANCASLNITSESVLHMRPANSPQTLESEASQESVENGEAHRFPDPTERPLDETLSPECIPHQGAIRSRISCTVDSGAAGDSVGPPVLCSGSFGGGDGGGDGDGDAQRKFVENESGSAVDSPVGLSERQRVLQAELYEEAKRCQLFASPSSGVRNDNRDAVVDEAGDDTFIEEIIGQRRSTAGVSNVSPPLFVPSVHESEDFSPSGMDGRIGYSHPFTIPSEILSQGVDYYGMYMPDSQTSKSFTYSSSQARCQSRPISSVCHSGNSPENTCLSTSKEQNNVESKDPSPVSTRLDDHTHDDNNTNSKSISHNTLPKTLPVSPRLGIHTCREGELATLVESLQDDVNDLLALHVHSETVKRALQRSLSDALERVRLLEEDKRSAHDQLNALIALHTNPSSGADDLREVVSVQDIRAAIVNTAAAREAELLRRENATLERRLAQELRRRREMAMTLEDLKGHIRVIVRVRPPLRFVNATVDENNVTPRTVDDGTRMLLGSTRQTITLSNALNGTERSFDFYRVCAENTRQVDLFSEIAPLIQLACDGVNISVLAYGQTGSGKTYTILGNEGQAAMSKKDPLYRKDAENDEVESEEDGILPRTLRLLFQHLMSDAAEEAARGTGTRKSTDASASHIESSGSLFEVSCSLVELYNDHVHDLLAPPQIVVQPFQLGGSNKNNNNNNNNSNSNSNSINANTNSNSNNGEIRLAPKCDVKISKDGRTHVVGLTQHVVRDSREALQVFRNGAARRQVHTTLQNPSSSRSHAIFTVTLSQRRLIMPDRRKNSEAAVFRRIESKIVLVDLAGSERIGKSQSVGERLREAQCINKSLAALGDVVAALSQSQINGMAGGGISSSTTTNTTNTNTNTAAIGTGIAAHVPYRNNKLTALLQDALGGRSKTVLIACVSPSDPPFENHTAETLTTLQFASRVRCVRNVIQPMFSSSGAVVTTARTPVATTTTVGGVGERGNAPVNSGPQVSETDSEQRVMRQWQRATESSKQRCNRLAEGTLTTAIAVDDAREDNARPVMVNINGLSQQQRVPMNHDVKPRMRF